MVELLRKTAPNQNRTFTLEESDNNVGTLYRIQIIIFIIKQVCKSKFLKTYQVPKNFETRFSEEMIFPLQRKSGKKFEPLGSYVANGALAKFKTNQQSIRFKTCLW